LSAYGVNRAYAGEWIDSHCYQYANRLAHLHFRRRRGVAAWLAQVYYLGDQSHVATARDQFDGQRARDAAQIGINSTRIDRLAPIWLHARRVRSSA